MPLHLFLSKLKFAMVWLTVISLLLAIILLTKSDPSLDIIKGIAAFLLGSILTFLACTFGWVT